ncbi:MGH1-like glycoside hydrolase domain-containing protein, partial [Hymenobacter negativus]|nr:glycogen debranching protein [Hymenobacter negativus]
QTYPRWMQPVDIYQSENLGTNAVHYQANIVLAQMAIKLGQPGVAAQHKRQAEVIKFGINQHLWQADKGYYGQYLYGRTHLVLSPRAEALGEALCVLFGIAEGERAQQVVSKTPTTPYGISCIYPQIPGLPPYHNDAVWPFVQSFWALAAAKVGNEPALTEGLAAIYRPAALFLTNKENFVARNGDFAGTQINSSNMLWSLSGSLSLVYKVLFGMQYQGDLLVFRPFVPQAFQGRRKLMGFRYRRAVLDVTMEGFGNVIQSITLDDKPLPDAAIPAGLTGRHTVSIALKNQAPAAQLVNRVDNAFSPETPALTYQQERLHWTPIAGATAYKVLRNGKLISTKASTDTAAPAVEGTYQVVAVGAGGLESFASEPLAVGTAEQMQLETLAPKSSLAYQGFTGSGFVEVSTSRNTRLTIAVAVPEPGLYALDFRYANGNGPINTQNKCAIRTLRHGSELLGTVVLPQRGVDEWSNWGYSNPILVRLDKGSNALTLAYEPANHNMNGLVNQAMLDCLRLRRVQ